ncbi:ligand-gated ion channel 50-like [Portunus trituberculatus]|uniref:ligand-gated ion channel 50-like n=1 Tax=Portunus trituberculatus TaxID=210409 RepID=UPI001E1CCAE9|nr:ligand-gated ion channel 50-like [Portunus trituberculatus]
MLATIACLTFYFDVNDFTDRIMVALTAMLVLAAFFTQTSNTIPKTAYLKLIDVWYLVLICQVFAIIVSLVYVENLRLRYKLNTNQQVLVGYGLSVLAWRLLPLKHCLSPIASGVVAITPMELLSS